MVFLLLLPYSQHHQRIRLMRLKGIPIQKDATDGMQFYCPYFYPKFNAIIATGKS